MTTSKEHKNPLNIFISYAHEDRDVALTIQNMLQDIFGSALCKVFIDTSGIPLGGEIRENIMNAVLESDTMIVVATGAVRATHEWTGWELGAFQAIHKKAEGIRGRVITLCMQNTVPGPLASMRYVPIGIERALLELSEEEFERQLSVKKNDEILMLLGEILDATERELDPAVRASFIAGLGPKVRELKKEIFSKMKKMIREVRKPQHQLLVRYDSSKVDPARPELPPDATVTEFGGAFSLFDISANHTAVFEQKPDGRPNAPLSGGKTSIKWSDFKAILSNAPLGAFWTASLSQVVLSPSVDNDQVIATGFSNRPRRFRLVVTTSTVLFNREVETSVYLIETLQRRDYGNPDTTMLLKGLHIVARFRFMFLENEGEFYPFNVQQARTSELPGTARQLILELDRLNSDALQAELHRPAAWKRYVSEERLKIMTALWMPIEAEVRSLCERILRGDKSEHESLKLQLVAELEKIEDQLGEHNCALLRGMASNMMKIATEQQTNSRFLAPQERGPRNRKPDRAPIIRPSRLGTRPLPRVNRDRTPPRSRRSH